MGAAHPHRLDFAVPFRRRRLGRHQSEPWPERAEAAGGTHHDIARYAAAPSAAGGEKAAAEGGANPAAADRHTQTGNAARPPAIENGGHGRRGAERLRGGRREARLYLRGTRATPPHAPALRRAPSGANEAGRGGRRSPICPCPSVSASISCLIQDPSIMRTRWRFALLGLVLSAAASPSFADDLDELRKLRDTTISLVNALVEQGVLTRAKADAIIAQAEQAGAKAPANAAPGTTNAPAAVAAGATNSG